jgi:FixJ family two-component response regulator
VADDSPEQRSLVRDVLTSQGFDVVEVADGRELFWALERCSHSKELGDATIVADVVMPIYGGLDVLEAWSEVGHSHPLVVMTGFADDAVARRTRNLGAVLLSKPFPLRDLARAVHRPVP